MLAVEICMFLIHISNVLLAYGQNSQKHIIFNMFYDNIIPKSINTRQYPSKMSCK